MRFYTLLLRYYCFHELSCNFLFPIGGLNELTKNLNFQNPLEFYVCSLMDSIETLIETVEVEVKQPCRRFSIRFTIILWQRAAALNSTQSKSKDSSVVESTKSGLHFAMLRFYNQS